MSEYTQQLKTKIGKPENFIDDAAYNKNKIEILQQLIEYYMENNNMEESLKYSEKATELIDSAPELHNFSGDILQKQAETEISLEKFEDAEMSYDKLIKIREDNAKAEAYFGAAYNLLSLEKFEKAEIFFRTAKDIFEENNNILQSVNAVHAEGNVLAVQKMYSEALAKYEEASELYAENKLLNQAHKTFLNTRLVFMQASSVKKMLKYFKKRLKRNTHKGLEGYLLQEIALAYNQYENKKKEAKYIKEAIESKTKFNITKGVGYAYSMLGDFYDSEADDKQALQNYFKAADYMLQEKEFEHIGPVINFLKFSENEMNQEENERYKKILNRSKELGVEIDGE